MDLVRLVLERAKTSREAVTVCSSLLEEYGQGGGCAEDDSSWCYENGFLFADKTEAWVLETAGTCLEIWLNCIEGGIRLYPSRALRFNTNINLL